MRTLGAAILAAGLLGACSDVAVIEYGGGFPAVMSENLAGETLRIPEDLAGRANLVIVGYAPAQQDAVDQWARAAEPLLAGEAGFAFYALSVTEKLNALARTFVDANFRLRIRDPERRARTMTVFTDLAVFNGDLGIDDVADIHAFVIDQDGRIAWRAAGVPTAKSADGMQQAVSGLLK